MLGGVAAALGTAFGGRADGDGASGAAAEGDAGAELLAIPGERVPENLAFADDGDLYVGITAGEVRRLPADRTDERG